MPDRDWWSRAAAVGDSASQPDALDANEEAAPFERITLVVQLVAIQPDPAVTAGLPVVAADESEPDAGGRELWRGRRPEVEGLPRNQDAHRCPPLTRRRRYSQTPP